MMRLIRLGDNAHMLETSRGALLFSYEGLTAVRVYAGGAVFRSPGAVLSVATRAHLQRFAPGRLPPVLSGRQFAALCRAVLADEGPRAEPLRLTEAQKSAGWPTPPKG